MCTIEARSHPANVRAHLPEATPPRTENPHQAQRASLPVQVVPARKQHTYGLRFPPQTGAIDPDLESGRLLKPRIAISMSIHRIQLPIMASKIRRWLGRTWPLAAAIVIAFESVCTAYRGYNPDPVGRNSSISDLAMVEVVGRCGAGCYRGRVARKL